MNTRRLITESERTNGHTRERKRISFSNRVTFHFLLSRIVQQFLSFPSLCRSFCRSIISHFQFNQHIHRHCSAMTTKTTITLSPIKRCSTSPHLKKRRLTSIMIHRKHQTCWPLSPSTTMTIDYLKPNPLSPSIPDLVQDILIEQQRREAIVNIATTLRKVGDQLDEQLQVISFTRSDVSDWFLFASLQINKPCTSSSQRSTTFVYCLSHVLRFFLQWLFDFWSLFSGPGSYPMVFSSTIDVHICLSFCFKYLFLQYICITH